ncbi:DUF3307 domain-containing protein [Niabella aquatica]
MTALFLKLLLAHLLGDFVFQPAKWVADKNKRKAASPYLYLHIGVHAALLLMVLQFNIKYWQGFIIILISHYVTDVVKLYSQGSWKEPYLFFIDQICHILVIAGVTIMYTGIIIDYTVINWPPVLLLLCCIIAVTYGAAIVMRLIMNYWKLKEDNNEDSLQLAGKYIGMTERLLVFLFVILNQWSAIGFLIAAKSILRFSDLSRAKDRKLTEYIIIGTLLSICIAIMTGLIYQKAEQYL